MKKIIPFLLVLTMLLSLCGCGGNSEVTHCEELIDAIGEVSLDSAAAIEAAENAYSSLTDKQKEQVGNYLELVQAKEIYEMYLDSIVTEEKAKSLAAEALYKAIKVGYSYVKGTRIDTTVTKLAVTFSNEIEPDNCKISFGTIKGSEENGWELSGKITCYDKYGSLTAAITHGTKYELSYDVSVSPLKEVSIYTLTLN